MHQYIQWFLFLNCASTSGAVEVISKAIEQFVPSTWYLLSNQNQQLILQNLDIIVLILFGYFQCCHIKFPSNFLNSCIII